MFELIQILDASEYCRIPLYTKALPIETARGGGGGFISLIKIQ